MRIVLLSLLAGLVVATFLAYLFQDQATLTWINPDRSYEAYTPPPAPDYAEDAAWFQRGAGELSAASVFVVHSNVYRGDGNWNAPHDRETQARFLEEEVIAAEVEPFEAQGLAWVPRYRQPTLFARFTQKHPGTASRQTAYEDVRRAFLRFLRESGEEKPIIVAGYGDGALLVGQLWLDEIAGNEDVLRRTAAVYAVGMPLPARPFDEAVCEGEEEPRCLLGFAPVDERFERYQERLRSTTLTLDGRGGYVSSAGVGKLCQPPYFAPVTEAYAPKAGGAIPWEPEARCEEGLYIHARPGPKPLRQRRFFGQQWYPNGVNLWAEGLADDAHARVAGALRIMAQEAMIAPPLPEPEEVRESEIHEVPN